MSDPFQTTAARLDRTNLGNVIRFQNGVTVFQDTLSGISHEAELVEDHRFNQEVPDYMLGRITTVIRLAHAGSVHVAGSQEIELMR